MLRGNTMSARPHLGRSMELPEPVNACPHCFEPVERLEYANVDGFWGPPSGTALITRARVCITFSCGWMASFLAECPKCDAPMKHGVNGTSGNAGTMDGDRVEFGIERLDFFECTDCGHQVLAKNLK